MCLFIILVSLDKWKYINAIIYDVYKAKHLITFAYELM